MMTKNVRFFAVFAGLMAGISGVALGGSLGAGIQDAALWNRAYSFAEQCVATGELAPSDLVQFQTRLLDALEEKYSLAADERQVLKEYLVGSADFSAAPMDQEIVPAGRGSCAMATKISG